MITATTKGEWLREGQKSMDRVLGGSHIGVFGDVIDTTATELWLDYADGKWRVNRSGAGGWWRMLGVGES
jgi:hypothetical protein